MYSVKSSHKTSLITHTQNTWTREKYDYWYAQPKNWQKYGNKQCRRGKKLVGLTIKRAETLFSFAIITNCTYMYISASLHRVVLWARGKKKTCHIIYEYQKLAFVREARKTTKRHLKHWFILQLQRGISFRIWSTGTVSLTSTPLCCLHARAPVCVVVNPDPSLFSDKEKSARRQHILHTYTCIYV